VKLFPFLREDARPPPEVKLSEGSRQRWSFPKDVQKKVASFGNLWRFPKEANLFRFLRKERAGTLQTRTSGLTYTLGGRSPLMYRIYPPPKGGWASPQASSCIEWSINQRSSLIT